MALEKLYPGKIDWAGNARLIGSRAAIEGIRRGDDPRNLEFELAAAVGEFGETRKTYLLY